MGKNVYALIKQLQPNIFEHLNSINQAMNLFFAIFKTFLKEFCLYKIQTQQHKLRAY